MLRVRLRALRSLRWNYRRRGVWVWLKGRHLVRCDLCEGDGRVCKDFGIDSPGRPEIVTCPTCGGTGKEKGERGYQRILSEPERVLSEQTALAEGVFA